MQSLRLLVFLHSFHGVELVVHALRVEHRHLDGHHFARHLAYSLVERLPYGRVVVVADQPDSTMQTVERQWRKLKSRVAPERGVAHHMAEDRELPIPHNVTFSAKLPEDFLLTADITFATANDLLLKAPECRTMYITYGFSKEKLHLITSWMPRGGVVIIYE